MAAAALVARRGRCSLATDMGPERGPGRLDAGSTANRQLCPRPLPFSWQRAAMAKVKRGLLLSIPRACSQGRTTLAKSQQRKQNDEMEAEKGVGYANYVHDRTSRVPRWPPCATVSLPHDEQQRC